MESTFEKFNKTLNDIGLTLVSEIRDELANQNVNAFGDLSDSLEYRINSNAVEIWGNDYMQYAEFGRPKGRVPYNFAYIIAAWAIKKGIALRGITPVQFGWAVRQNTIKYGSAKYVGKRPVNNVLEAPVQNALDSKYGDLQQVLVEYINDNICC